MDFGLDRVITFRFGSTSLNHPCIAHIYGLEESDDTRCIVMELIEGEALPARIKRGPIPVDEALTIAKAFLQIPMGGGPQVRKPIS